MRLYLEASETVPANERGEFIRADVTGMTDAEVLAVKAAIEDVMAGRAYLLTRHTCRHDEGNTCDMEVIEIING